ncbi:hypothetical protein ACERZ8_10320 [Tateyamaria armeniaca]|uniref:Fibronectin-binding protein n=1 Tax=Tateyamaria armeniaca TaxID=2518930 RepID=A0ABW8USZ5_9RHOB
MSILTRRFFVATLALAMMALPATAEGLSGSYIAEGLNPDGSAYQGTVQLVQDANVVSFAWRVGNSTYAGTGVQEGRVITVNWGEDTPVIYVTMPDGSLHGTWADGRALERLTPN